VRFRIATAATIGAVVLAALASPALAYSGVLSGSFSTWNKNGGYCDPGLTNCTGSYYSRSGFDAFQPIKNAHLEVFQGSTVIGQGSTDDNGNFSVAWNSTNVSTTVLVRWFNQHKDNRFVVNDTAGTRTSTFSGNFTLTAGTTAGSPQYIGGWHVGSSDSPDWATNVYLLAEMEWRTSFALVGELVNSYTNVEIRGLSPNIPGYLACPTACASGKKILIATFGDALVGYNILHESGHVANYVVKPYHGGFNNYCWPRTSPPDYNGDMACTASRSSPEWGATEFEEGYADFSEANTLWSPSATHPTICSTRTSCADSYVTNMEITHYPFSANTCSMDAQRPESRWPMSVLRFLWDIYDDVNDADGDTISEGYGPFWHMYANMTNYANGTGPTQIDEPWLDTTFTSFDNLDGRGTISYKDHYATYTSVHTLWVDNCSPF
jgi:hypothetical protein